jgi:hypothetical protein
VPGRFDRDRILKLLDVKVALERERRPGGKAGEGARRLRHEQTLATGHIAVFPRRVGRRRDVVVEPFRGPM